MQNQKIKINFKDLDFYICEKPLKRVIEHELQWFKKHQQFSWISYQKARIDYLKKSKHSYSARLFLESYRPKIALFPGSFNPFHAGHLNILKKAEQTFDKIIIAVGQNTQKSNTKQRFKLPRDLSSYEIIHYSGLLTDCIRSVHYPVTVIRGLRNTQDFEFENMQLRYLQDTMPEVNIVYFIPDREFLHISSSGIRSLQSIKKHQRYLLP